MVAVRELFGILLGRLAPFSEALEKLLQFILVPDYKELEELLTATWI